MTRKILYEPFAHNGLPADYMFFQRKYYNTQPIIYPSNLPRPIDMWNERPLYGKVDTFERFVFPFTPSLKTVGSGLLAINFVADAYKAMATFMQGASAGARSSAGSLVHIETPVKAADDLPLLYERYFKEDLDPLFVGSFLTSLRQAEIKSFADYLRFYVTFARANPQFPHSQVDFLASNRVSNRVSGLMIEVPVAGDKRLPYDADKPKWDHFLSQTFFPDYAQIAEGFGFYVNKHIPWMLVANLNSKHMHKYMAAYETVDAEDVFRRHYLLAEHISYESFKKYMFASYCEFVKQNGQLTTVATKNTVGTGVMDSSYKTKVKISTRPMEFTPIREGNGQIYYEYSQVKNFYSERFLFQKYIEVRLAENRIHWAPADYRRFLGRMKYIILRGGTYEATKYLAKKILQANKKAKKDLTRFSLSGMMGTPTNIKTPGGGSSGY